MSKKTEKSDGRIGNASHENARHDNGFDVVTIEIPIARLADQDRGPGHADVWMERRGNRACYAIAAGIEAMVGSKKKFNRTDALRWLLDQIAAKLGI